MASPMQVNIMACSKREPIGELLFACINDGSKKVVPMVPLDCASGVLQSVCVTIWFLKHAINLLAISEYHQKHGLSIFSMMKGFIWCPPPLWLLVCSERNLLTTLVVHFGHQNIFDLLDLSYWELHIPGCDLTNWYMLYPAIRSWEISFTKYSSLVRIHRSLYPLCMSIGFCAVGKPGDILVAGFVAVVLSYNSVLHDCNYWYKRNIFKK